MPLVYGFAYRFFELHGRGREWVSVRTFMYRSSTYMRMGNHHRCDRWSVHVHLNQLPRFIFLFHIYKVFFTI